MKKTLTTIAILISISSFSQQQQSKPVHLTGPETDSTKNRLVALSQKIAGISSLTQGEAATLQVLLSEIFQTITRKEEKITTENKPKQ